MLPFLVIRSIPAPACAPPSFQRQFADPWSLISDHCGLTPLFSHSSARSAQTTARKNRPTSFLFFGLHTLSKATGDGSPHPTVRVLEQGGWGPLNSTRMNTYAKTGGGGW